MVFPFIYGAFFGGLMTLMGPRNWAPLSLALMVAVMGLDVAENIQLVGLLYGFPNLSEAQIALASQTTQAKFWAIQGLLLWLLGLTLWRIYKRLRA